MTTAVWSSVEVSRGSRARRSSARYIFSVTVEHPALTGTDGFVWLRVHAATRDGSSVDQTVQRAYRLD